MKNKKASHVGVVLSFVIFVVFLVFLYSIFEPVLRVDRSKEFAIDHLEVVLLEEFSANLVTVTFSIKELAPSPSCIKIPHAEGVEEMDFIIKDSSGNILLNKQEAGSDLALDWNVVEGANRFFKVYYYFDEAVGGNEDLSGCQSLGEDDYTQIIKMNDYVFEDKVEAVNELVGDYSGDYENLKEDLKVPVGSDFGFVFINNDGEEVVKTVEKDISTDVFVRDVSVQYVDDEINVKSGFIKIKVW